MRPAFSKSKAQLKFLHTSDSVCAASSIYNIAPNVLNLPKEKKNRKKNRKNFCNFNVCSAPLFHHCRLPILFSAHHYDIILHNVQKPCGLCAFVRTRASKKWLSIHTVVDFFSVFFFVCVLGT